MPKEPGLEESFTQEITALLESFSEEDEAAKNSLSQLLLSDPRVFAAVAMRILSKGEQPRGVGYLVRLLTKEKVLPASLLDTRTNGAEAVAALRTITETGTNLQPLLELALKRVLQEDSSSHEITLRILRVLDLLAVIAPPTLWNSFQLELMSHPDKMVRSKATLLIGGATKNAAWLGRRFMDRDPRVQASAVEALWNLDAADSKPLLLAASKSRHNRAAANAALGLYRISEAKAVGLLLEMARHPAAEFRTSALWAIGETQDPRFLPFLADQFKSSEGRQRLAVTRALGRIRRREKEVAEAGTLRVRLSHAEIQPDGRRRLAFALASQPVHDLSGLTKFDFAVWEGSRLIEDYEVKSAGNPAVLAAGFVTPRFRSTADPWGLAVAEALTRCQSLKRPEDLWRIDRYSPETGEPIAEKPAGESSAMPYDEAFMTAEVKKRYGFIAAPELLAKIISSAVSREAAAQDAFLAVQRQCEAFAKVSGTRHLFLFLHEGSAAPFEQENRLHILKELLTNIKIVPHLLALGNRANSAALHSLSKSIPEGSFTETTVEELPGALEDVCSLLINGFEISYQLPKDAKPEVVTLKVSSRFGAGQAEIQLQPDGEETLVGAAGLEPATLSLEG